MFVCARERTMLIIVYVEVYTGGVCAAMSTKPHTQRLARVQQASTQSGVDEDVAVDAGGNAKKGGRELMGRQQRNKKNKRGRSSSRKKEVVATHTHTLISTQCATSVRRYGCCPKRVLREILPQPLFPQN